MGGSETPCGAVGTATRIRIPGAAPCTRTTPDIRKHQLERGGTAFGVVGLTAGSCTLTRCPLGTCTINRWCGCAFGGTTNSNSEVPCSGAAGSPPPPPPPLPPGALRGREGGGGAGTLSGTLTYRMARCQNSCAALVVRAAASPACAALSSCWAGAVPSPSAHSAPARRSVACPRARAA
jgi:hypothetical protein